MILSRTLWRALTALALASLLGASSRPVHSQVPRHSEARDWLAAARATLDSLARQGDVAGIGRRFAADAVIVLPDGSTLNGWDELHELLLRLHPDPDRRLVGLRLMPSRVQRCVDATHEFGGDVMFMVASGPRVDSLTYRYAAEWLGAPPGDARIGRLSLARAENLNAFRSVRCVSPEEVSMRRRRLAVAVLAPIPLLESWTSVDDFTSTLRERGYGGGRLNDPETGGVHPDYLGTRESNDVGFGGALRYSFRPPYSAEVAGTVFPRRNTIQGYDHRAGSHISLYQASNLLTLTAGYHWTMVRAGAGLAAVHTNWRIRDHRMGPDGGFVAERDDTRYTTTAPGGVAQLSFIVPMSQYGFAEIRGQGWLTRRSRIQATESFQESTVSTSGYALNFMMGIMR